MASQQQETQMENPMVILDGLYCEEEHFEGDLKGCGSEEESGTCDENVQKASLLWELDLFSEDDELGWLISKEKETQLVDNRLHSDRSTTVERREAVEWMLGVIAHYGFTVMTTVFAVNYFDRFVSRFCFQGDKPWMSQLAAVACLSLAAKVEETQVPLLLDLQVEESKYVFEAKTIKRMELLVLSTLQWKMNPVTPLSFLDHVIKKLRLKIHLHLEFLWRCERLLLSVITDSRFIRYLPSELAAASLLHVIKEVEPCNGLAYQNHLMAALKISKDRVDDCYQFILELSGNNHGYKQHQTHKRKYHSVPGSPNAIIEAHLSSESSNDSWALTSSTSASPEPLFKKTRSQDQQLRFASLNSASRCA